MRCMEAIHSKSRTQARSGRGQIADRHTTYFPQHFTGSRSDIRHTKMPLRAYREKAGGVRHEKIQFLRRLPPARWIGAPSMQEYRCVCRSAGTGHVLGGPGKCPEYQRFAQDIRPSASSTRSSRDQNVSKRSATGARAGPGAAADYAEKSSNQPDPGLADAANVE